MIFRFGKIFGSCPKTKKKSKINVNTVLRVIDHICLFEDDSKYIFESVRLNNEPYQKKKTTLSKIILKAREIWKGWGRGRQVGGVQTIELSQREFDSLSY